MEQLLTAPPANIYEVRIGQAEVLRQAGNEAFDEDRLDDAEFDPVKKTANKDLESYFDMLTQRLRLFTLDMQKTSSN